MNPSLAIPAGQLGHRGIGNSIDHDFNQVKVVKNNSWGNKVSENKTPKTSVATSVSRGTRDVRGLQSFKMYISDPVNERAVEKMEHNSKNRIIGTYDHDYNILEIHNIIIRKFHYLKDQKIKRLKNKLQAEIDKVKRPQTMIQRRKSIKAINKINSKIKDIEAGTEFIDYIKKVKPLVEEYREMGSLNRVINFGCNKPEIEEPVEEQYRRHCIISDYIDIASSHIQIDLLRQLKDGNICRGCEADLDVIPVETDEQGIMICSECGFERMPISHSPFCKDTTRVNASRNNYEDRENFKKVILRYQGKQIHKPPAELYVSLDKFFMENNMPLSDDVKKLPMLPDGTKRGTNRELMYEALKNTGNAKYYDHINLILNVHWGWKLDDVSHLEEDLMDDYDISQEIYNDIPKERKSSLNSQFRLYKLLRRRGHNCLEKNFKIPTTSDIREFHEMTWMTICKIAGWENV